MSLGFHTVHFSPMFGGDRPVLDVITATAAAGFDAVGVDLASIEAHVAGGGSVDDVADAIAGAGLACSDVLVLVAGVDDLPATARRLGTLAEALDAPVCIAAVGAPVPWPALVRSLGESAGILVDHGCRLAIEFVPYSPLGTLQDAIRLCAAVGWHRTGVVIDSLHFFRSGAPWDDLHGLRADQVLAVQWSDVPAEPPRSLVDESRNRRLLPGTGGLRLAELAATVRHTGYDGVVSAEILSEQFRSTDPATLAQAAYEAMADPAAGWVSAATR